MNDSKNGLNGMKGEEPVLRAVLGALEGRLKLVRQRFKQATRNSRGRGGRNNEERIHQLRVATRRASAALDLYAEFLPRKRAEKMAKTLKRIRRTAGNVRDCDLLLSRFSSESARDAAPSFVKRIRDLRQKASAELGRLHDRQIGSGRFKRQTKALLRKTRRKATRQSPADSMRFSDWAPEHLRIFLTDFFDAASPSIDDFAQLHQFRIRSKALRYAMELVAPGFPPEFNSELYPVVEHLQTLLGNINDESTFLTNVARRLADDVELSDIEPLKHRMAEEQQALDGLEQEFASWWTPQRREDLKLRFDQVAPSPAA